MSLGILSALYKYGTIGYIGGGFGKGIHNILEAAAAGLPVIFGPQHHKFAEARDLISLNAAFEVTGPIALKNKIEELCDPEQLIQASRAAVCYVTGGAGATGMIMRKIFPELEF